jgi:hypothetical protein
MGHSQMTFGVKISGLAFHPKKELNEACYRWKIDKKGKLVGFVGVTFTSAYQFNNYVGVKFTQTFMPFDCAGKFASVTHLGINLTDRIVGWKNDLHRGSVSIGPLFYLRKGWLQLDGYEPDTDFIKTTKSEKWQRKFVWYGGQMQYDYYFKTNQAVSVNFFPGYPYIYSLGVGETFRVGN